MMKPRFRIIFLLFLTWIIIYIGYAMKRSDTNRLPEKVEPLGISITIFEEYKNTKTGQKLRLDHAFTIYVFGSYEIKTGLKIISKSKYQFNKKDSIMDVIQDTILKDTTLTINDFTVNKSFFSTDINGDSIAVRDTINLDGFQYQEFEKLPLKKRGTVTIAPNGNKIYNYCGNVPFWANDSVCARFTFSALPRHDTFYFFRDVEQEIGQRLTLVELNFWKAAVKCKYQLSYFSPSKDSIVSLLLLMDKTKLLKRTKVIQ